MTHRFKVAFSGQQEIDKTKYCRLATDLLDVEEIPLSSAEFETYHTTPCKDFEELQAAIKTALQAAYPHISSSDLEKLRYLDFNQSFKLITERASYYAYLKDTQPATPNFKAFLTDFAK